MTRRSARARRDAPSGRAVDFGFRTARRTAGVQRNQRRAAAAESCSGDDDDDAREELAVERKTNSKDVPRASRALSWMRVRGDSSARERSSAAFDDARQLRTARRRARR
jgi:hypothetical protein